LISSKSLKIRIMHHGHRGYRLTRDFCTLP
jgi:hypothetical protein